MHFLIGLAIIVVLLAVFPRALAQVIGGGITLMVLITIVLVASADKPTQHATQQQAQKVCPSIGNGSVFDGAYTTDAESGKIICLGETPPLSPIKPSRRSEAPITTAELPPPIAAASRPAENGGPAATIGSVDSSALGMVLFLIAGGFAVAMWSALRGRRFWKVEVQLAPGDLRRHHIPYGTRDEALVMAGRFLQAAPDASGHHVFAITARADRHWYKQRIADYAAADQIQEGMLALRDLTHSQAEMARIRAERAKPKPVKPATVDWKDVS